MRIVEGADWRDGLAFETPVRVAEIAPGDPARCVRCDPASALRPREELWAVKHRHPNSHSGHVRFYCDQHVPKPAPPAAPAPSRAPQRRERAAAPRRSPSVSETPRPVCPTCFVEVPSSGICGVCGERVG
jgi:hypothetical protein